jgi:glycosyltransferase involved in cell wall biosynthesis
VKKIRVAFFAEILTEDLDGAVRTMFQLIKRIDPQQFDFLFIYGSGPDTIGSFKSLKIPTISLPFVTSYAMALPMFAKKQMQQELHDFQPDVIHIATPSLLGHWALQYAGQRHIPVISIYHTHFISYIDYYFKHLPFLIKPMKKVLAQKHKAFYNSCDKIYVPSESIKQELNQIGIDLHRMQLWKRGIDTDLFSPLKKDKRVVQQLTDNNRPAIMFASRLVWEKNLETLFAIYEQMQSKHPEVNFLVAGNGTAFKACRARMKNAIFTSKIDHSKLSILYASADVFVFPSVSETYGNVVLEAMASGLPCVIADGGGSQDFIKQGVNGFKCQPYNAADYVEKIEIILTNKVLKKHIVEEGLNYSRAFNWEELACTYFNNLQQLAKRTLLMAV